MFTVLILKLIDSKTRKVGNTLDWIFMALFPNYNMASCFSNIYSNYLLLQHCEDVVCSTDVPSPCCKGRFACSTFILVNLTHITLNFSSYFLHLFYWLQIFCFISKFETNLFLKNFGFQNISDYFSVALCTRL